MLKMIVTIEEGSSNQMILSYSCAHDKTATYLELVEFEKVAAALLEIIGSDNSMTIVTDHENKHGMALAKSLGDHALKRRILPEL